MADRTGQGATVPASLPKRPASPRARLGIVGAAVVLAIAAHLVTDGRWSVVLAGMVGILSILAIVPRFCWLVLPVGAYAGLWVGFNLLRAGADDTSWADRVLGLVPRAEAWVWGDRLPSTMLQDWFYSGSDLHWYDYGVTGIYLSFFLAPHVVAILLLWRDRSLFWRYVTTMSILFALAMACFYLLPTSPPWMVAEALSDAGFARIQRITEPMLASLDLPIELFSEGTRDGVRTSEVRFEPNPIAAMPSIHFAVTALLAFPARRAGPVIFGMGIVYATLMAVALVYLGEHYILDLVAGGAMTGIGWVMSGRMLGSSTYHPTRGRQATGRRIMSP